MARDSLLATFIKTDSGKWKAKIRLKGFKQVSKTFRTKRDAKDWARRTEDEMVRGVYIQRSDTERLMLVDALDRYLSEMATKRKPDSHKREVTRANNIKKHLGQYSLAAINSSVIAKYRDTRLAEGKANNTVRLELAILSHMYTTAIQEWGLGIPFNPVLNVRKPSPGEGRNRRLVGDEEERLIAAVEEHSNPMLGWIVKLALYTGMRKSEILFLNRNSVEIKKRVVNLPETKNGSARTVPLSDKALSVLKDALSNKIRIVGCDFLFPGEPGKTGERKPIVINKTWKAALDRAGIKNLKFHDLRHEATSRFVEAGLSDQEVSSITGHKSMQMLKRYTHLRSSNLTKKIKNI